MLQACPVFFRLVLVMHGLLDLDTPALLRAGG